MHTHSRTVLPPAKETKFYNHSLWGSAWLRTAAPHTPGHTFVSDVQVAAEHSRAASLCQGNRSTQTTWDKWESQVWNELESSAWTFQPQHVHHAPQHAPACESGPCPWSLQARTSSHTPRYSHPSQTPRPDPESRREGEFGTLAAGMWSVSSLSASMLTSTTCSAVALRQTRTSLPWSMCIHSDSPLANLWCGLTSTHDGICTAFAGTLSC